MVCRKRHQRQEREEQREGTTQPSEATAGSGGGTDATPGEFLVVESRAERSEWRAE